MKEKKSIEQKNAHLSKKTLNNLYVLIPFTTDYALKLHGRLLSDMTGISQRKVSDDLMLLEKNKILKSSKAGNIKYYSLNFDNPIVKKLIIITEEYKAINFIASKFLFNKLMKIITEKTNETVLIFGSYARGDFNKNSDLDILFFSKKDLENIEKEIKVLPMKINPILINKRSFESGLKQKKNFMLEVFNNHIILNGSSDIVNLFWRVQND
jgi:predicted nucleotidyltransferase